MGIDSENCSRKSAWKKWGVEASSSLPLLCVRRAEEQEILLISSTLPESLSHRVDAEPLQRRMCWFVDTQYSTQSFTCTRGSPPPKKTNSPPDFQISRALRNFSQSCPCCFFPIAKDCLRGCVIHPVLSSPPPPRDLSWFTQNSFRSRARTYICMPEYE